MKKTGCVFLFFLCIPFRVQYNKTMYRFVYQNRIKGKGASHAMKIYNDISALVGHTPLVRLHHLEEICHLSAQLVAKIEACNPLGSAKDRVGLALIEDA